MKQQKQTFNPRQYMLREDFELFHNKDDALLGVEFHDHHFYEAFFYISGKVTYVIEGKSYKLRPGDIILINNREIHRTVVELGSVYERVVLWIDPGYISRLSRENEDLATCFTSSAIKKYNLLRPKSDMLIQIKNTINRLEKALNGKGFGNSILTESYLGELLVYMNRAYQDTRDEEIEIDIEYNPKISEVIRYINANLDQSLTLEELSARFYISKYHLLREFKKSTGYTIHRFIHKKRMILARELLAEKMKVTETCIQCGFGDYANFIRAFKKEYGVSPKKFVQE